MQLVRNVLYATQERDFKIIGSFASYKAVGYINSSGVCELVEFYSCEFGIWRPMHKEPFQGATNIYKKEFGNENNLA